MAGAKSSPLYLAAHICLQVIDKQQSLDRQLTIAKATCPAQQQAWLQEITYGVCRYYGYYDAVLQRLMSKPIKSSQRIVHFVLVCALHQLQNMNTPDYAVLDESVKLTVKLKKQWAKALVNGVLRQFLRKQDDLQDIWQMRHELSFSGYIGQQLEAKWPQKAAAMREFYNQQPPLWLRVNRQKISAKDYLTELQKHEIAAHLCEHVDTAVVLETARNVETIPGFTDGMVSVQDVSAQFAAQALQLQPGLRVLDGCAAPGGKTGELLEAMPDIDLVAIDVAERTALIEQNLQRLHLTAKVIAKPLQEYVQSDKPEVFARILLDVPCSGSGVIARHPDIRYRRLPGDLEQFQALQLELLQNAWTVLAPDGLLLYITCSVFTQENDEVITRFMQRNSDAALQAFEPSLLANLGEKMQHGVQRIPSEHIGDGFYYCLLSKKTKV